MIATDTRMSLTPEHVGVIRGAIKSHLLGLSPSLMAEWDRFAEQPDCAAIEQFARKLQLCVKVLTGCDQAQLHPDEDLLALLGECEAEEDESADYYAKDGDNDRDTVAIMRGRAATLRLIRDMAQSRLAAVGGDA